MRGLMLIMLLGAASESYSSWYETYMSRRTVQRYAPWLGGGLGAGLGGALGYYGAGRYMGYDPYLAAVIGLLLGSSLGGYGARYLYNEPLKKAKKEARRRVAPTGEAYLRIVEPHLRLQQRLDTDINFAIDEIRRIGIRYYPLYRDTRLINIHAVHAGPLEGPTAITHRTIEGYVNRFLNGDVTQNQIVDFNNAIIGCLKDADCCDLNSSRKRFFLRRFFNIYADPNKANENNAIINSFYSREFDSYSSLGNNREPLSDNTIDDVINYLNENNRFNSQDLFGGAGEAIKG